MYFNIQYEKFQLGILYDVFLNILNKKGWAYKNQVILCILGEIHQRPMIT